VMSKFQVYLHVWQLPLVALFLAGWILGGGWLLHRATQRSPSAKVRRISVVRCYQLSFLSGVFGMGSSAITLYIFAALSRATHLPLMAVGAAVATAMGILLALLVFHASLSVGIHQSMAMAIRPLAAVIATALLLGACAYFPARRIFWADLRYYKTFENLKEISRALKAYDRQYHAWPNDLQQLIDTRLITANLLVAPINPHLPVGYFYKPPGRKDSSPLPSQLVAVSLISPKRPGGRALLLADGELKLLRHQSANLFLDDETNADFTDALLKAEQHLPPPPKD